MDKNKLFADHLAVAVKGGKVNATKSITEFISNFGGDSNSNPDPIEIENATPEMISLSQTIIKKRTKVNNNDLMTAIQKIASQGTVAPRKVECKNESYQAQEY